MADYFTVGYGGWASILFELSNPKYYDGNEDSGNIIYDGVENTYEKGTYLGGKLVQVTSANIARSLNLPVQTGYYLPFKDGAGAVRSPVRVAYGTFAFNGEISFELTNGIANGVFNNGFYKRNSLFSVQFFDGQNTCTIRNCVWNSVNLNCSPGSTVKVSIAFMSNNGYLNSLQISHKDLNDELEYNSNDLLIPYWQCGKENFTEFSVNFSRNVTPVYLNNDLCVPSYLRPGIIELGVSATTVKNVVSWGDNFVIKVGSSHSITLNGAVLKSRQYQMSSMNDTGAKTYEWTSIANSPSNSIFAIS